MRKGIENIQKFRGSFFYIVLMSSIVFLCVNICSTLYEERKCFKEKNVSICLYRIQYQFFFRGVEGVTRTVEFGKTGGASTYNGFNLTFKKKKNIFLAQLMISNVKYYRALKKKKKKRYWLQRFQVDLKLLLHRLKVYICVPIL